MRKIETPTTFGFFKMIRFLTCAAHDVQQFQKNNFNMKKTELFGIPGQDQNIPTSGRDKIGIEKNNNTRDRDRKNMTRDRARSRLKTLPVLRHW
jgi:hypothetical protein